MTSSSGLAGCRACFPPTRARQLRPSLLAIGLGAICVAVSLGPPAAAEAVAQIYARQIDAANASALRVGGIDATGGIDDWALGNGVLCGVVSDLSHEGVLTAEGGLLIDLGHCGRNDDQWNILHSLVNLSRHKVPPAETIRAETGPSSASIITTTRFPGIEISTRFALDLETPDRLLITTRLSRREDGPRVRAFIDLILHGRASLTAFSLSLRNLEGSAGFDHPRVDSGELTSMVRAIQSIDAFVWPGAEDIEPGVSYGLRVTRAELWSPDGSSRRLHPFAIAGIDFSLLGVLARPFWFGGEQDVGLAQILQGIAMDLSVGETLVVERELRVGMRSDVASITDAYWPHAPLVLGRVDDPAARIHVRSEDGAAITFVRPDPDGHFSFRLPAAGHYQLEARAPGGRSVLRSLDVVDPADGGADPIVEMGKAIAVGAPAIVRLPQAPSPLRLVFRGIEGTPDPVLHDNLRGYRVGEPSPTHGSSNDVSLVGAPSDPRQIALPPGRYRIYATRGPSSASRKARSPWHRAPQPTWNFSSRRGYSTHPDGSRLTSTCTPAAATTRVLHRACAQRRWRLRGSRLQSRASTIRSPASGPCCPSSAWTTS